MAVLSSCLGTDEDEDVVISENPSFFSFKFIRNDSVPFIETALFTLEYDSILQDSIIVNLDSLPYKTRLDSVAAQITFISTSAAYYNIIDSLGTGTESILSLGTDTLNFSKVLSVRNIARNGIAERTYPIKINIHSVQPELYHWFQKKDRIYSHSGSQQKAIRFKGQFFFYVSSGVNLSLYTSADGVNWSSTPVSGLPAFSITPAIEEFNQQLFLVHENGQLYTSSDGTSWSTGSLNIPGYSFVNLLFVLENQIWSTVQHDAVKSYYFATSADGAAWQLGTALPAQFPVADFAALSFKSRTNHPKALVMGGYSAAGTLLRNAWSVQRNVYNEYKWVDFSVENNSLGSLAGASIIHYDNKLLMYGGMDVEDNVREHFYMESIDEGLTWRPADTINNVIQDTLLSIKYTPRSYQSVIHKEDTHQIFLIGGRTKTTVFSDVWAGKLNRMSFLRQ